MADEDKKTETVNLITDELKLLVDGTAKRLLLTDRFKTEHDLPPLTVRDLIDFEKQVGSSVLQIMNASLGMEHIVYLLYCSLRKEGLNFDQIKAKKWKYSEADVQEMFDMGFLRNAVPLFTNLLKISGFDKKEEKENPPKAPVAEKLPA